MVDFVHVLWQRRFVRYGLVGAVGVPINLGFLVLFSVLLRGRLESVWADRLAAALAFELSAILNLIGNQRFTFGEQTHVRGWEWIRRGIKLQAANIALAWTIMQIIAELGGVNKYVAQALGIGGKFVFSYLFANRFVYRPASIETPLAK
jgi:putative flippase GtrA